MSNTAVKRQEYPNETRQQTAIRLRAAIRTPAHPPITGTTIVQVPNEERVTQFTFVGHPTQEYIENAVKWMKDIQESMRAIPVRKPTLFGASVFFQWEPRKKVLDN